MPRSARIHSRAGHDADALLGLHSQGQQPGGDPADVLAGLLPGDGLPGVALGVAERLALGGLGHPLEELHGHVGRQGVDEAGVDRGGHEAPAVGRFGGRDRPGAERLDGRCKET